MKKIILIGRFNEITKGINDAVSKFCHVQLCPDNVDSIRGMLKLVCPSLVIVSLAGVTLPHDRIFPMLERDYINVPVVVIGSMTDENNLTESGYLKREKVKFLRRPLKLEEITKMVQTCISNNPEAAAAEQPEKEETVPSTKPIILVVDDSPMFLRTVQSMLSQEYRVIFATSGPQAIAVIAKTKPDLILLDYEMPVCNGKMTMQMLRSEDSTKDIPIIFLTGMAEPAYVQEVLLLQPDGYLLKPPSEQKLFEAIRKVLDKKPKKKYT